MKERASLEREVDVAERRQACGGERRAHGVRPLVEVGLALPHRRDARDLDAALREARHLGDLVGGERMIGQHEDTLRDLARRHRLSCRRERTADLPLGDAGA